MPSSSRVSRRQLAAGLADEATLESRKKWYLELLDLLRVRARTIDDIVRQAQPYFLAHIEYDPEAVAKNWKDRTDAASVLRATEKTLASVEEWNAEELETALRALGDSLGIAAGKVFQPLRVALTGLTVSPGIFEVLLAMGRDLSLTRVNDAIAWLEGQEKI